MRRMLLVIVLPLAACGTLYAPQAGTIPLTTVRYDARPDAYPITLLTSTLPTCAFDEIATATAFPPIATDRASAETLLEMLRVEARKVGGDAIVRVREVTEDEANLTARGIHKSTHYTGTVIRFRDAACKT